ncbi:MAG TPA: SpoIIE family protein phosphatase [Thermoanaerobaculia bacterium]|jgi:sigma-B regulation protein RsbU (phosphoserine phosphatase)|nr:SpoIIE family protein phosphatase [Thermoanaerobaculia bacterium]
MSLTFESARLDALVESARMLQGANDVDQLLQHLLRSAMAHVLARRGVVAREGVVTHARGIAGVRAGDAYDEDALRAAGIELILPVGTGASIGVGSTPAPIQSDQEQFLTALVGISAGAVENVRYAADVRRLNFNLDRKLQELRTLLDLVRGFTSVVEPEEVVRLLALTLAGQWTLARYAIFAWKEGHPPIARAKGAKLTMTDALPELAASLSEARTTDALDEGAMRDELIAQKIAALIPLRSADQTIGIVLLGARPGGAAYSLDELEYTRGLADQAAVALENAWHFRETVEKKKLEQELSLAADIQNRLLPATLHAVEGYDVAANTRPARHVGGDYYDVIARADGRIVYCVADVSGKGIAASLLMSNFQASLRALLSSGIPLAEIVTRMNNLMHASTAANKFVTAIFMDVDPATGHARVVNAGHNDGVILRADGTADRLKAGGLAVGLMAGRTYAETEWQLAPGDLVALYSDGVTEANDPDEEEYSIERLIEFLREQRERSADEIVRATYESVDAFAATAPQYDDITMMVLMRLSSRA